ncbi:hypothetical protein QFZ37_000642 [Chryseobacterium ginsenosidimutans]|uniref:hypothetical protein n=1 Tax=Chryseobacterium ginsenosidimutans TaxID=687846 RepID=UPI00278195C8|nr:hypothetical protein [Chryseobacterium ginsenosidimutans]MDQ0592273.1 hypothetical protein [Chryseobacterium ginsenosidimutans]
MKVVNGEIIIYKDEPTSGLNFFWLFVFSVLFIITAGWVVGLFYESFWNTTEDIIFCVVLFIFAIIFFFLAINTVKDMMDTNKEKPLVVIDKFGIKFFNTPIIYWINIEKIVLIREFDIKHLNFYMKDKQEKIYRLDDLDVSEFRELARFRRILKQFFDNVEYFE